MDTILKFRSDAERDAFFATQEAKIRSDYYADMMKLYDKFIEDIVQLIERKTESVVDASLTVEQMRVENGIPNPGLTPVPSLQ